MMAPHRGLLFAAAASAMVLTAGPSAQAQSSPLPKPRPAVADNVKITTDTRVYLLRGLLNIFSLGMDTLAEKMNQMGIKAEVFNHDSWTSVAAQITEDYKRGQRGAVVLIGHSLGADVLFLLAERLDKENIPVRLAVPFDPTGSYEVPKNVDYLLNLYQHNGFGRRVAAGPGFHGELTNMDLTKDESIGHGSIDKSPQLHDLVIAKIKKVALGPTPRKRHTGAKAKTVAAAAKSNTATASPVSAPAAGTPAPVSPVAASPRT